jgi:hypothetical protein
VLVKGKYAVKEHLASTALIAAFTYLERGHRLMFFRGLFSGALLISGKVEG